MLWLVGLWFWFLALTLSHSPVSATVSTWSSVNLLEVRVSASYRRVLDKAYDDFVVWTVVNQRPRPDTLVQDAERMSRLLADYVQFLFQSQRGVSAGRHVVLSIQHRYRHLRTHIPVAWDAVKSWEQLEPVRMQAPMPMLVLQAMFAFAMLRAFQTTDNEARDWFSFAVGLKVSFTALLRPGEWCALSAAKVAVPAQRLYGLTHSALLTIINGKNRRVFGRIQIALTDDTSAIQWLSWLTSGMIGEARLFPGGTAKFRRLFAVVVKALGITAMGLTPASLRAGGATWYFATGLLDLGRLKYRGRWASLQTLEHYVQEATASLVLQRVDLSTLERLETIVSLGSQFEAPPCVPWTALFSRARQVLPGRRRHGPFGADSSAAPGRGDALRDTGVGRSWPR